LDNETFGRLAYEFSEVASRLHSLNEYILKQGGSGVLLRQQVAMQGYAGVLLERIEAELD
jgi:hypothetical protein